MPNLIDHLVFRARVTPNSAAIVGLNRQLTYGQLLRLVQQAASKLRRTGIRAGDRVVTRLQDEPAHSPNHCNSLHISPEEGIA